MTEEKRIYVIVAETVDTPSGVVVQPCGRIAAQCAHVVSKMRLEHLKKQYHRVGSNALNTAFEPVTTIVLAAPDTESLEDAWIKLPSRLTEFFYDTNEEVYGPGVSVMTAICTYPIEPSLLGDALSHLPLWSHSRDVEASIRDVVRTMSEPCEHPCNCC